MTDDDPHPDRRLKRVPLYNEWIGPLFSGRANVIQGLPPDIRLRDAYEDAARDTFTLVFQSDEFDPVEEGEVIPEIKPNAVVNWELRHLAERWRARGDDQHADELEAALYGDQ
jgi:hypothetical protein